MLARSELASLEPEVRPSAAGPGLLRVLTCGSVDDGKSTLLGRLLLDTGNIPTDLWAALAKGNDEAVDLAHLFDGLEAEREQGITIDVTYRAFVTPRRRFRLLDAPGHEQYTRNMATAATGADLAILLVDAEKGLLPQTRRHAAVCDLFGVRHIVLAVNKMDRVGFDQRRFDEVVQSCADFARQLSFLSVEPIPLSALGGDNVVHRSERMGWWRGQPLLSYLETFAPETEALERPLRLPIQLVLRSGSARHYAGSVASGRLRRGDQVLIAPSRRITRVVSITAPDGPRSLAEAGEAVTVEVADNVDLARGDVIAPAARAPNVGTAFAARLLGLSEHALIPGRSYELRVGTATTTCAIGAIRHRIDVGTLGRAPATELAQNEIGLCEMTTTSPIAFDPFADHPGTGAFILIDRVDNATVGAGVILHELRRSANVHWQPETINKGARAALKHHRPAILWFTGLSGAGKSTIANLVEERLWARGCHTMLLDGDNVRHGLNADLGFTEADRVENIRRAGQVARLMVEAGLIVLCSFISPYRSERRSIREIVEPGEFIEIFVDTPVEECVRRDPKGLYAKAIAGAIPNFTGISAVYETPEHPELRLATTLNAPQELAAAVMDDLVSRRIIAGLE